MNFEEADGRGFRFNFVKLGWHNYCLICKAAGSIVDRITQTLLQWILRRQDNSVSIKHFALVTPVVQAISRFQSYDGGNR